MDLLIMVMAADREPTYAESETLVREGIHAGLRRAGRIGPLNLGMPDHEHQMIGGSSLELPKRSVHIWTLQIGSSDEVADAFDSILNPDEKERAGRFRFDHLRRSFVITSGVLRCLLGRYLALHPSTIRLQYGPKGKPLVAPDAPVDFNLSHSGEMAVFAFTAGCPIGVDLERVRALAELQAIASRFFCPEETAEITSLP